VFNTVELLEAIILALPTPDVLLAATVSRKWQQVVEGSLQIFNKLDKTWHGWTHYQTLGGDCNVPQSLLYPPHKGHFARHVLSTTDDPTVSEHLFDPSEYLILFLRDIDYNEGGSIAVLGRGPTKKLHIIEGESFHFELLTLREAGYYTTFKYTMKDESRNISFEGTMWKVRENYVPLWAYLTWYHPGVANVLEMPV
jgi:hypothetical protein